MVSLKRSMVTVCFFQLTTATSNMNKVEFIGETFMSNFCRRSNVHEFHQKNSKIK